MYREENNKEILRWVKQDRPRVWYPYDGDWDLTEEPIWSDNIKYIVDDKHAEIRKQVLDNPKLEVEVKLSQRYIPVSSPDWDLAYDYRIVKPKFKPFIIEVKTEDEAIELWHRLHMSGNSMKSLEQSRIVEPTEYVSSYDIWEVIDNHIAK